MRVDTGDWLAATVGNTSEREAFHWAYNLTINTKRTHEGGDEFVLVHSAVTCSTAHHNGPASPGTYVLHYSNGKKYVRMPLNMHARVHAHARGPRGGFVAVTHSPGSEVVGLPFAS